MVFRSLLLIHTLFALLLVVNAASVANNVTLSSNNSTFQYAGGGWSHIQGTTCGDDAAWAQSATLGDTVSLHFVGGTSHPPDPGVYSDATQQPR